MKGICRGNRDGSYATQRDRERQLTLIANQLHALGFRQLRAKNLKPKHIEALVEHWKQQQLSTGTIKNRMSCLRWWAEKINKRNVIARDNSHYGIETRTYAAMRNKGTNLAASALEGIKDQFVRLALELQRLFGLRREEAIKFQVGYADHGDRIRLKSSWTKGGKARDVPVRTHEQRDLLDRVRDAAGRGSLIPPHLRYVDQLRIYERQTANAGLSKLHGLRHQYAQDRYFELTGWHSPVAGGPSRKDLAPEQRDADRDARLIISHELGHERIGITNVYLGS